MINKKSNDKECVEYRTISLIFDVLKIFLKIINKRIYTKIKEYVGRFRNDLGTRDALFAIQALIQWARDVTLRILRQGVRQGSVLSLFV